MEEPYSEEKYNPCIMKDGNFSKPFERSSRTNSYGVKVQKLIPTQFHKSPLKMLQKNPRSPITITAESYFISKDNNITDNIKIINL